ncbi:pyruvate kinase [Thauera sinica]|uniref:pyruvate kinase n=1 Tax=Thauera sinica TaxID=2665146 RepID=A0ABW1ANA4_9RHOO|nr:pyruvate kinase [Thauera sp. K11]ATE60554.1 pyruvate kinase [Thauera sp. K11]
MTTSGSSHQKIETDRKAREPDVRPATAGGADKAGWDTAECLDLIAALDALRARMLDNEARLSGQIGRVAPAYQASARNLAHYLALREVDLRAVQERLARMGTSSLGRAESHVLANLDKVLGILHRLMGEDWEDRSAEEPVGIVSSRRLLDEHTDALLGAPAGGRGVRIMVTLPSEAAVDYGLVHHLVASGMDVARINCAHDGAAEWEAMATHVRRAAKAAGRGVRILMDLGGPKLRTGPIAPGPALLKLKPRRDLYGRVLAPARVGLRPAGSLAAVAGAIEHLGVPAAWLARIKIGDTLELVDARDAKRTLHVVAQDDAGILAECERTAYVVPETTIEHRRRGRKPREALLVDFPPGEPGSIFLQRGDRLKVTRSGIGRPVMRDTAARGHMLLPTIACTLPEVFDQVCVGERVLFDDGRIGGRIGAVGTDGLEVEITQIRVTGDRLLADKGINLPDSRLDLPALTEKDVEDLQAVARCADLVGLSFVQRGQDIETLREQLARLGAAHVGVVLKIETRRAFENLPELLFSAMACDAAGVMIARGDLAVECGYERLAEVQEEILWAAEAAHMPVIWATQVLETLAKTGQPSRAEITDAAMGERAECVMLNKGPHILEAIRMLDDILKRMQAHQSKKRSLLRALGAWSSQAESARQ